MSENEDIDFAAESAGLQKQFEAGDGAALLDMFVLTFVCRQLVPDWAGIGLTALMQRATDGAWESWDQVLGPPGRVGKWKEAVRRSQERLAYESVEEEVKEQTEKWEQTEKRGKAPARDNDLFDAAAQRSGVGARSKVKELRSAYLEKFAQLLGAHKPNQKEQPYNIKDDKLKLVATVELFTAPWQGSELGDKQRRQTQAVAKLGERYHWANDVDRRALIRKIAQEFPHIESKHLTIVEKEFADRVWVLQQSWLRKGMSFYELLWRRTRFLAGYIGERSADE